MATETLTLGQRIKAFFTGQIPTQRRTRYGFRGELPSLAHTLDVDRVHGILRAAEAGDVTDLFALYRDVLMTDAHLQGEFGKRKLAVLGDPFNLQAADKKNADDLAVQAVVKEQVEDCPDWLMACSHLLDSSLWPVAIVEKVYRASAKPGRRYELAQLIPVPERLLDYTSGRLKIRDTDPSTGMVLGTMHEVDLNRYIVHRGHLLNQPDNWGGPMRSLLFWWLLVNMDRDWWARYLERSNAPFLLGKYDQNDDASRSVLERAFSLATKLGGLVVSKETEVEIKSAASTETAEGYEKFLQIGQNEISKLITGQAGGMESNAFAGDGKHKQSERVRQDIRAFDGLMLGTTLRNGLFAQIGKINGLGGRPPKALWGAESYDNAKIIGELLSNLSTASFTLTDDAIPVIAERLGFNIQRTMLPTAPGLPLAAELELMLLAAGNGLGAGVDKANQAIARSGAAPLARAFRGRLAPVRQIILSSSSAAEAEAKLKALYADLPSDRLRPLIEDAIAAQAANAVAG